MTSTGRGSDPRVEELKRSLGALKLKDIDVDVTSTQLSLQQELSTLRAAVENGGSAPAASNGHGNGHTATSERDAERLRNLDTDLKFAREQLKAAEADNKSVREQLKVVEADNKSVREQLKDSTNRLTAANDSISRANGNASEAANAEINMLKSQVASLKKDLTSRDTQIAELNATITAHVAKIGTLTNDLQTKAAAGSSKEKALQADVDKARADLAQLEAKNVAVTKEWEARYGAKVQELGRIAEDKARELQELETRLEAEKEELMDAMAQEVEVRLQNSTTLLCFVVRIIQAFLLLFFNLLFLTGAVICL